MKLFTPEQMNHQDLDSGFIAHTTRSSHTYSEQSCTDTDFLILLLLAVLIFFDTPPTALAPSPT
ncbi:MAG: hypothetical protein ACRDDX_13400 [Cellulosilyticaceae bacterium]